MNKMLVFASMLCSLLFCCERHKPKSGSEMRLCKFITSPEILGVKRIKIEKKYYVFQVDANVEDLIKWINSSPVGIAAFPHNERDEMHLSLTNSLRAKGDKLTLIHGTYSFNVDGKEQMAQIEVGLESKGSNVYKVQIRMLPINEHEKGTDKNGTGLRPFSPIRQEQDAPETDWSETLQLQF